MTKIISIQQVAKSLGISAVEVKRLVKQGILHPKKREKEDYYFSLEEIAEIRSRKDLTLSQEAAQVGIQIQREVVASVSGLKKILRRVALSSLSLVTCLVSLIIIISVLFNIDPGGTSDFFGYYYRFNVLAKAPASSGQIEQVKVLAAATEPEKVAVETSILADVLKPVAATSLLVVKATDSQKYEQIVTNPALNKEGPVGLQGPVGPPGPVGPQGLQGSPANEVDTLSSVTGRGATTATAVTLNGGATISTINGLTLTSASDGLTLAGGTTSRTLTLAGADITLGSTIKPTSDGGLTIQSSGANTLTLDAGGADGVNIGTSNASALTIGRPAITTTVEGTADVNNLKIGSGTTIVKHLSATTTFDASEIAKSTCSNSTVVVAGANIGDIVIATPTPTSGGTETLATSWSAYVENVDTVTIRICALEKLDPPNQTWRVDVWQH